MAVEYHDADGDLINEGFYRIINDRKGADYEDVAYFSVNSEGDLIAEGDKFEQKFLGGGGIPLRVSRIDEPGDYATWLEMNAKWLRETAKRKEGELAALASRDA